MTQAKRGKRKGDPVASGSTYTAAVPEKSALAAEDVYYEGPPAITETIAPTISILTVVGIIPAMAAWARQAWVRYRITNRRIRVTSGFGGQDMAEIVYADIVELRTAKRLFGDGDLVAFLRDGAKFEMRNIPNFDEAIEFILKQVSPEVAQAYRTKGEVTKQK
jgi:Bacterial PH domain